MIFDASNSHIQLDFSHISVYKKYTANKPSKLGFLHLKTRALRLKIIYEPSKLFSVYHTFVKYTSPFIESVVANVLIDKE